MARNVKHIILIVIILIISCALVYVAKEYYEDAPSLLYYKISDDLDYKKPSDELIQAMQDLAGEGGIKKASEYYKTQFLLFETLNMIDQVIVAVRYPRDLVYIYGVRGSDTMASKSNMALVIQTAFPADYDSMMPRTYVLENSRDQAKLVTEFLPNSVYITKKNIQRQQGNVLTNKLADIVTQSPDSVVAQLVLQDPYIVNDRKINLRVYMLVTIDPSNNVTFYIYNDGFIYYTPKSFKAYSLDSDEVITTGYIDRDVYISNPMTFEDLRVHMARVGHNYPMMWSNIIGLMKKMATAYTPILKELNKDIPGIKFLVYGCDIAPDNKLGTKIMEINKGPDLSYKDERDKKVKLGMVREMFGIVGILKRTTNNFVVVSK